MAVRLTEPLGTRDVERLRAGGEQLGARLPALLVEAERIATTVSQGVHGRRRTGVGETFWQFRPYQTGDPAQDIDWRQSARTRQNYIREQEWEAAQSVWLWLDQSPSMRFRSRDSLPAKVERGVVLGLALAGLLVRGGERVALLREGERPTSGRFALNRLCVRLVEEAAAPCELPPAVRLPRSARLVLISDFLAERAAIDRQFARFAGQGVEIALLHVIDPAEEALPFGGRVLFEGLEREGQALVGNVRELRERYRRLFRAHRDELRERARRQNWRYAAHHTDHSPESGLLTLYQMLAPHAAGYG